MRFLAKARFGIFAFRRRWKSILFITDLGGIFFFVAGSVEHSKVAAAAV